MIGHTDFRYDWAAWHLVDPALAQLAVIVLGADTARPDLGPQAAGLLAVSLGLSNMFQKAWRKRRSEIQRRCSTSS